MVATRRGSLQVNGSAARQAGKVESDAGRRRAFPPRFPWQVVEVTRKLSTKMSLEMADFHTNNSDHRDLAWDTARRRLGVN